MRSRERGFTLIELMIAVVVMVILMSIAIPSYQENVARSRRSEVQAAIVTLAQALERYFTINNTYTGASLGGATPIFPPNVPSTGGQPNYILSLTIPAGGNTYTITATRSGGNAADKCGDFTLAASGARGVLGGSKTLAECWS